jgi:glycosyltransferase involved in cell wall biosynthesis
VLGIGKALREASYEVLFGGMEPAGRPEDLQSDGSYRYAGFAYHSIGEKSEKRRGRRGSPAVRLTGYLSMGASTAEWLCDLDFSRVRAVILYNGLAGHQLRIAPICAARGVPLIPDCTEWYDPGHSPDGRFGFHRWNVELTMRRLNARAGSLIVISSYLARFYEKHGARTLLVPPLVDLSDPKWTPAREWAPPPRRKARLVYAGDPGQKDLLIEVLRGLRELREEGIDATLTLVGPESRELGDLPGGSASLLMGLGGAVNFTGRLRQDEVPRELMNADFGVLLRPDKRYAQAGFPTKLVEYLSSGLPVITNFTSDIASYVRDGKEGFLLDGCSGAFLAAGVRRALEKGDGEWGRMRNLARRRAEESFNYGRYVRELAEFIDRAGERSQKKYKI